MKNIYRLFSQLSDSQIKMMQKGLPQKKKIENVKKIILVSSAKGGVGKSTVAANLAISLIDVTQNKAVGILDCDVFGPSQPCLFNVADLRADVDSNQRLLPLNNYGVKIMSIGSMIDPDSVLAWRGLMVMSAIEKLLYKVNWGHLDCLVVDLPPGTGDVQLSVCQRLDVDGALLITTPHQLSLIDVRRGLQMFRTMKVPVLGLVRTMSHLDCSCGRRHHIFGDRGHGDALGDDLKLLCDLPIEGGDLSGPIVASDPQAASSLLYQRLAADLWRMVSPEGAIG